MTLGPPPPPVPLYKCPKCSLPACTHATGGMIMCTHCFAMWPNKAAFDAVRSVSIDFSDDTEDTDYIESGQMKEDIEKLIARAVADKMLNFTDRLAYDVRELTTNGDYYEDQIRAVRSLVNRHRDEARTDWTEVADGDEDY